MYDIYIFFTVYTCCTCSQVQSKIVCDILHVIIYTKNLEHMGHYL